MTQLKKDLIAARDLISHEYDWTKNEFKISNQDHCSYCTVGAIQHSVTGDAECSYIHHVPDSQRRVDDAKDALRVAVVEKYPGRYQTRHLSVITFNDDAQTTHSDVIDVFNIAIANATVFGRFVRKIKQAFKRK